MKDFLSHVKATHGTKTYQIYELALQHLVEFTGDVSLTEITSRSIDMYKVDRLKKVSPATVNLELRAFKSFFNCLRRWETISKNPCDGLPPVKIPQRPPAYLTVQEFDKFIGTLDDLWLKRIVLFTAMTGARLGEVLNLTWDDINVEVKSITIRSGISYQVKGGKVRTIPLNKTAWDVVQSLPKNGEQVFSGKRGRRANSNHVSRRFRVAARKAGLDRKIHFHSLRHTFASWLVQRGVSLYQVQKLLGHSSSRITEIYAHLQHNEMHSVVNVIALDQRKD